MSLAGTLVQLGHRVVFHAHKTDAALAEALGVELRISHVSRFPRKLQDFRFFRQVDRAGTQAEGLQIALARVRARDGVICGGTHRGYMIRARKLTGPFDWLQIWMETQAYSHARVVVSHSNLCTEELVRLYRVPDAKIVTVYPPVDGRFSPVREPSQRIECRRRLGLPLDRVVLLFPSMGHSRKGLQPLCQALSGFSDRVVVAVAGRPPSQTKWPFLHYLGYLNDMVEAYQAADFTILGSYYEPFGLVGPESIMCGTRLVFEENIGCLAAIKSEYVLTFSVWDAESIRRAVARAIELARQGHHHFTDPLAALRYNPSVAEHAKALVQEVTGGASR